MCRQAAPAAQCRPPQLRRRSEPEDILRDSGALSSWAAPPRRRTAPGGLPTNATAAKCRAAEEAQGLLILPGPHVDALHEWLLEELAEAAQDGASVLEDAPAEPGREVAAPARASSKLVGSFGGRRKHLPEEVPLMYVGQGLLLEEPGVVLAPGVSSGDTVAGASTNSAEREGEGRLEPPLGEASSGHTIFDGEGVATAVVRSGESMCITVLGAEAGAASGGERHRSICAFSSRSSAEPGTARNASARTCFAITGISSFHSALAKSSQPFTNRGSSCVARCASTQHKGHCFSAA